jgi:hypothetical protein
VKDQQRERRRLARSSTNSLVSATSTSRPIAHPRNSSERRILARRAGPARSSLTVPSARRGQARQAADMLAFSKFCYTCARMQNRSFCVPERVRSWLGSSEYALWVWWLTAPGPGPDCLA